MKKRIEMIFVLLVLLLFLAFFLFLFINNIYYHSYEVKMLFFIGNSSRLLCVDYKNVLYHNSILVTLKTNLATYAA